VYFTSWSAGMRRRIDYLVDLHRNTSMNAVVIDVKDFSGYLAFRVAVPEAKEIGAIQDKVRNIDAVINRLHGEGIYVIARITAFQDPVLAAARPELAVHSVAKLPKGRKPVLTAATLWLDRKGLAWIDPASQPAWDYLAAIASDALGHGFDEINFDYVRFPSDGDLKDMYFPAWDGKTPKHKVISRFFGYLRKNLDGVPISADLFGLATVDEGDMGIGQVIEDGYADFDYVCPMVYPSHFARKFLGFANPAEHPYEVVKHSMQQAAGRLSQFNQPPPGVSGTARAASKVKLRPWLQDFNLGAKYTTEMVEAQIQAVHDALGDRYAGYLLWSPSNIYTRDALDE